MTIAKSTGLAAFLLLALAPAQAGPAVKILTVDAVTFGWEESDKSLVAACRAWALDARKIRRFFRLSKEYPVSPYHDFYQVTCNITGTLEADGQVWTYRINGGATAFWTRGETTRYFGCSSKPCEPLVLLPPGKMHE